MADVEILTTTIEVEVGEGWAVQWTDLLNVPTSVTAIANAGLSINASNELCMTVTD